MLERLIASGVDNLRFRLRDIPIIGGTALRSRIHANVSRPTLTTSKASSSGESFGDLGVQCCFCGDAAVSSIFEICEGTPLRHGPPPSPISNLLHYSLMIFSFVCFVWSRIVSIADQKTCSFYDRFSFSAHSCLHLPPCIRPRPMPTYDRYSQRSSHSVGARVQGTGLGRRLVTPSAVPIGRARTSLLDLDYSAKVRACLLIFMVCVHFVCVCSTFYTRCQMCLAWFVVHCRSDSASFYFGGFRKLHIAWTI